MQKITAASNALIICLGLAACQPEAGNAQAKQRNFVCKALIEGFLTAQQLQQYELDQIQPAQQGAASRGLYIYKARLDHSVNVMPQQQKLHFACQQTSARKFQIQLSGPQQQNARPLLSVELPEPAQLKALTAFSLNPR
ncbi:hypothetical protein [Acinetobacter sp.]|uniref:hypothetical protein n=1 Tax=Acinetobacter sp. TaxID=472 RepID=UPI002FC7B1E3